MLRTSPVVAVRFEQITAAVTNSDPRGTKFISAGLHERGCMTSFELSFSRGHYYSDSRCHFPYSSPSDSVEFVLQERLPGGESESVLASIVISIACFPADHVLSAHPLHLRPSQRCCTSVTVFVTVHRNESGAALWDAPLGEFRELRADDSPLNRSRDDLDGEFEFDQLLAGIDDQRTSPPTSDQWASSLELSEDQPAALGASASPGAEEEIEELLLRTVHERGDESTDGLSEHCLLSSAVDGAPNPCDQVPRDDHSIDMEDPPDTDPVDGADAEEEEDGESLLRTLIERPPEDEDGEQADEFPEFPSMQNVRGIRTLLNFSFFPEPTQTAVSYIHPEPLNIVVALDV